MLKGGGGKTSVEVVLIYEFELSAILSDAGAPVGMGEANSFTLSLFEHGYLG